MISNFINKIYQNSSRKRLEEFLKRAAQLTPINALLLDAGAGEGYYRELFDHTRYHATDFGKVKKSYGHLNYICNLTNIPIRDETYDVVICTQVFEHLQEPQKVISEIFRILKPSGHLWFSAPLFFFEHEIPHDYYRYTRYGLRYMLEKAGFLVEEIDWLEGYYGSLAYQCHVAAKALSLSPSAYGNTAFGLLIFPLILMLKPFFLGLSFLFHFLETRFKFTRPESGKNFCGVAVKATIENNFSSKLKN